ncbi:hypothetical protein Patl1_32258 [Pistacia atlantica]|uniref:Uncharacterized protein n=1 Tax=Pistacia atlantica TaxID=434234 RepID=A0ACC1APS9_9ROSI|nr:hypothetical protein Patl1_32258 [Pistacia atlantica]
MFSCGYVVIALSIAYLYSIITTVASFSSIPKPVFSKNFLLHFAFLDMLLEQPVLQDRYVGWKGNYHVGWTKVCPIYDKFCGHTAKSVAMSLLSSIILALLSMLSIFSLYKRARE